MPPPNTQQDNAVQLIDIANAPVCYYHKTFGDKAGTWIKNTVTIPQTATEDGWIRHYGGGVESIRQVFVRQMPTLIRAHLATQLDSASLESSAV